MSDHNSSTLMNDQYSIDQITDQIAKIAYQIYREKDPLSKNYKFLRRRELVKLLNSNLKGLVLTDTLKINDLVKQAYEISPDHVRSAIVEVFKENLGNDSIYNPERVYPSNAVLDSSIDDTERFLGKLSVLKSSAKQVDNDHSKDLILSKYEKTEALNFKKEFLGIGNASNARKYAQNFIKGYESMIEEYEVIKDVNLNLINDFHILRNELKEQREDVVQLLVDLFGDRAKAEHPELFDLEKIEWYDFEKNWEELSLAYDKIEKHYESFAETVDLALKNIQTKINSQVETSWKSLTKTAKKRELNQADLVNASVQMAVTAGVNAVSGAIKSRNKSKEVVAIIQRDVELLKKEMLEDQKLIMKDVFRLGKLYTKFSDFMLPSYLEFIKANNLRIKNDFYPIYNAFIENEVIKNLKNKNNNNFKSRRKEHQQLLDFKKGIEYSESRIEALNGIVANLFDEVELVNSFKPKKPWIIINVFTLGRADKIYSDTLTYWNQFCEPVVQQYDDALLEIEEEKMTIRDIQNSIEETKRFISNLTKLIHDNSLRIKEEFDKSPFSTEQLRNLIDVVKTIINSSRTVLEIKIDDELLETEKPWR